MYENKLINSMKKMKPRGNECLQLHLSTAAFTK